MLTNPTIDMLRELGLSGMASAYHELEAQPEVRSLEHGEWLALLLEREATTRRQKRFEARARAARLRHDAQVENIDFRAARGLDRNLFLKLAGCDWIRHHHSLLLIGPAGVGKSWLACALGHYRVPLLHGGRGKGADCFNVGLCGDAQWARIEISNRGSLSLPSSDMIFELAKEAAERRSVFDEIGELELKLNIENDLSGFVLAAWLVSFVGTIRNGGFVA